MNRRAFLGSVGAVASLGTLAYATRAGAETLEIRVWFSEGADAYDSVADRVVEYVERVFEGERLRPVVTTGGVVSVSTEHGARVTSRGEWPAMVAAGTVGRGGVDPANDVNVLVTDGQMKRSPTGYGLPHVASVGGARYIARLEPYDDLVDDRGGTTVALAAETRTIQVLVHEIGHALGLSHDHGVVYRDGAAVVATPMISAYAFDPDVDVSRSRCGREYPETADRPRKLDLAFSACARRGLASDGGGPRRR